MHTIIVTINLFLFLFLFLLLLLLLFQLHLVKHTQIMLLQDGTELQNYLWETLTMEGTACVYTCIKLLLTWDLSNMTIIVMMDVIGH